MRFCEVYILLKVKFKMKVLWEKLFKMKVVWEKLGFSSVIRLSFLIAVVIVTATVQCDSMHQGRVHTLLVEVSTMVRPTCMCGLSETRRF